ncbi:hypothetical protein [Collimonas antrihumi]|uniref:hypothetical protein n=1 Tax=Collimonas antrihumi TaxID=1940615 RepID=UPI0031B83A87
MGERSQKKHGVDTPFKPVEIGESAEQLMTASSAPSKAEKKHNELVIYDPGRLFDVLIDQLQLKNDVVLSRLLDVTSIRDQRHSPWPSTGRGTIVSADA